MLSGNSLRNIEVKYLFFRLRVFPTRLMGVSVSLHVSVLILD